MGQPGRATPRTTGLTPERGERGGGAGRSALRVVPWLAWTCLILLALLAGWITARGAPLGQFLVGAGVVTLVGYLYLRAAAGNAGTADARHACLKGQTSTTLQRVERALNRFRLTKHLGLADLVRRTVEATIQDHVAAFAGSLTYHGLFAIFPFLLFLLSLLTLLESSALVDALLGRAQTTLPPPAYALVHEQIVPLARVRLDAALTAGAVFALLLALWGLSGAFRAVMDAMNVMYGVRETRPIWKVYVTSLLLSVAAIGFLLVSLVLVVFGAQIGEAVVARLGLGAEADLLWILVEWPVLLLSNLLAFALIYHVAPNVQRHFRLITPGAVLAQVFWLVFSLLFSLYVNEVDWFNAMYGTLAGLIVLLLYMYYSAYILLLGAEINRVLEEPAADTPIRDATTRSG